MSRRSAPSRGDRHSGRKGTPVGNAQRGRRVLEVPDLKPGQHRCPVCRAGSALTSRGNLRAHNDVFGEPCGNKWSGETVHIGDAPPVVLPVERTTAPAAAPTTPAPRKGSRLDIGSNCRGCGKWLPGERYLCGRCYARNAR